MNYSELQTQIADWFHRSDMGTVIPSFIQLAEERFNRELRVRDMEVALASTPITGYSLALPAGVADVKTIWRTDDVNNALEPDTLEGVKSDQNDRLATRFAHQGSGLVFNGVGSIAGVLYQGIPELSSPNTTNWLLTKHPSLYLFGAMEFAAIYTKADTAVFNAYYQTALQQVMGNEKRLNGPLVARKR